MNQKPHKIAIVWGPCSGKSTLLPLAMARVLDLWYYPLIVDEAARALLDIHNLKIWDEFWSVSPNDFQRIVLQRQIFTEDLMQQYATMSNADKSVILCDRGIMDQQAYFSHPSKNKMNLSKTRRWSDRI